MIQGENNKHKNRTKTALLLLRFGPLKDMFGELQKYLVQSLPQTIFEHLSEDRNARTRHQNSLVELCYFIFIQVNEMLLIAFPNTEEITIK